MINEKVKDVLNEQINKEFYAAYLYLAMSAHFDKMGLFGFANWTKIQAREEVDHGMIIYNYLIDRDCKVSLKHIDIPEYDSTSAMTIFENILAHEKKVTESVDCIAYMSQEECDMATRQFINWYLMEQVEEEKHVKNVIDRLRVFGDEKASLFLMDNELATREYVLHEYKY